MATSKDVLDRRGADVIGLFGTQGHMSALIRLSSGTIKRVEVGEKIGFNRIVAIDEQGVIISRNGHNQRLSLPSG